MFRILESRKGVIQSSPSPIPIDAMAEKHTTNTAFTEFPLHDAIQEALQDAGLTHATPIQAQTLPLTLAGYDAMGLAQTGTGKTAAFRSPCTNI